MWETKIPIDLDEFLESLPEEWYVERSREADGFLVRKEEGNSWGTLVARRGDGFTRLWLFEPTLRDIETIADLPVIRQGAKTFIAVVARGRKGSYLDAARSMSLGLYGDSLIHDGRDRLLILDAANSSWNETPEVILVSYSETAKWAASLLAAMISFVEEVYDPDHNTHDGES